MIKKKEEEEEEESSEYCAKNDLKIQTSICQIERNEQHQCPQRVVSSTSVHARFIHHGFTEPRSAWLCQKDAKVELRAECSSKSPGLPKSRRCRSSSESRHLRWTSGQRRKGWHK
ncbi:5fcb4f12-721d-431a-93d0-adfaf0a728b6, partial [Thermothielavioides terrestris]